MGLRVGEPDAGDQRVPEEAEPDQPGAGGRRAEEGGVRGEGADDRGVGRLDLNCILAKKILY